MKKWLELKGSLVDRPRLKRRSKRSLEEKRNFYYMLRFYMKSRLPILHAIELVQEDTGIAGMQELQQRIRNGERLSDALRSCALTDDFIDSCLQIGENTGDYSASFRPIIEYLDQKVADRKYFLRMISYPLLLLLLILLLLLFTIFVVTPQLHKTLLSIRVQIPWSMELLYGIYTFFIGHHRAILFFVIALLSIVFSGLFDQKLAQILQNFLYKRKIVRHFYQAIALRGIFWRLKVLTSFGIHLVPALKIVSKSADHFGYQRILEEIAAGILSGRAFYQMLEEYPIFFSSAILSYVKIGENTDTMPENLHNIVELMEIKTKDMTEGLKKVLQPAMIIVAGLMISGLLVLVLPIIYSATNIRGIR